MNAYASSWTIVAYDEFKSVSTLTPAQAGEAERYLLSVLGIAVGVTTRLLIATELAMRRTPTPTAMQIARSFVDIVACRCNDNMEYSQQLAACYHILHHLKAAPDCEYITLVGLYFRSERRFPESLHRLSTVAAGLVTVLLGDTKPQGNPTHNLEKLTPTTSPQDQHCSICQDTIDVGSALYRLPCGDCFHARGCLGEEQSIVTWMKTSNKCPNCNQLIKL